jgi:hypothetical protein
LTKDIELLIQVRGKNQNLSRAQAVKAVAGELGLSAKSVSGRVTRAENTISGRAALMQWRQENSLHYDRAQDEINALVSTHQQRFYQFKKTLPTNRSHYAVFLSDTHFPYHDVKALELAYTIIADLPGVAYISGLSDGFDFSTLSRWPDGRPAKKRAIDSDLRGVLDEYNYHLDTLKQIAPGALVLALVGNHDVRLLSAANGTENYLQLEVMQRLADSGLMFLSDFSRENIVKINNSLYWFHGKHARKNRIGGAKANYEYVKHALQLDRDFTLVFGHVHDVINWNTIKTEIYGAGCLCQLQPHYSRHSQHWKQGITISKIWDNENLTYSLPFVRVGETISAFNPFNGKYYEV